MNHPPCALASPMTSAAARGRPLARAGVVAAIALLALAGCDRRPGDVPRTTTPDTTTTTPAPMPPASAASQ